ncbi:ABC transporter substrate-binding protein [Sulfitobacter geojensis]|uniref:ABC transporter substrate-binding protein n=1 Tax=Sulfitobacter geojensis TaxID=1342299 RepID=UPI0004684167|nr:ABC transporter substrate-binding protein [Sulfitobacter geojensis]KHA51351.1 ABC-type sugar transport system, periplasmic component [Sulfitobacter geojensis]NYI30242.1 multiple sugar transport system substrate-binding protein [Sulfitobacter geojensis]
MLRRTLMSTGAAALVFAGLGLPSSAQMAEEITEPVTVTFYSYNLATAGQRNDATMEMLNKFMEDNPLITVEPIGAPSNEILSRVQADIVAGQQPDVAQLVFRDLIYAAHDLGAEALEDLAKDELAQHSEGMVENGLELGRVDGKTYGLAYTFSTPVMFINKDIFREAGLDPQTPPRTWEEVKAAGIAIQKNTNYHGFFPGAFGPIDGTFVYQSIVMSNGGRVREGNKLTFADDGAADAVAMLRDLRDSGAYADIDVAAHMDTFSAGKLGMFLFTSAVQNSFSNAAEGNFEMDVVAMPSFGDKPTAPTNSGSALYVLSKDPVQQRAAWELMKFLTSKYAYTQITSKIGYLPLRLDIVNDPKYLKDWVEANPLIRPNLEQLERLTANVAFAGPNYRQVENMMKDAATAAVLGDDDPYEVLSAAQDEAQKLMPSDD